MASTCSAIGISTPWARASPTSGPALLTPSATMCMPPTISSSDCPWPSAKPTVRFRLCGLAHVATRSPDAGQAAEGEHLPAERHAQATQLGQAPRDEHGAGVVPEAQPVADAGGDGHHVLGGAGDLAPDDVGAHVGAEGAGVHQRLHAAGQRLVRQRDHAGGRMTLGHLAGQVGSGEHAGRDAGQHLGHHLGHAQVGPDLNALGQADDGFDPARRGCTSVRTARKPCDGTAMNTMAAPSSASASDDVTASVVGEADAREVPLVLAGLPHGRCELGGAHPQRCRVRRHRRCSPRPSPTIRHR